jgi:Uncharacterised protein family UPF0547
MEDLAFCPKCYRQIPVDAEVCPYCGTSVHEWAKKIYSQRLIDALGHPLDDVRMRAIIALGLRSEGCREAPDRLRPAAPDRCHRRSGDRQ